MKFVEHCDIGDCVWLTGWGWLIVSGLVVLAGVGLAFLSKWVGVGT